MKSGTIIHPTVEIVIGEAEDIRLSRKPDDKTGFDELVVEHE